MTDAITAELRQHYAESFRRHGASPRGVDWRSEQDLRLRYDRMLDVLLPMTGEGPPRLLDVGCGYGGLLEHARLRGVPLDYTGIDVVPEMVEHASRSHPNAVFRCADVFDDVSDAPFDFVVCNGILTQKLTTSQREMDRYAQQLIRRMFALATRGIAFNVMTSKVDWTKENLYHRHPAELLAWCMAEITDRVKLDHAYPLFEYTTYLYHHEPAGAPAPAASGSS